MEMISCTVVDYLCDKCQTKILYIREEEEAPNEQKYIHICPKCQTTYLFNYIYPKYEYKDKLK